MFLNKLFITLSLIAFAAFNVALPRTAQTIPKREKQNQFWHTNGISISISRG
jgi:hypothetical protein